MYHSIKFGDKDAFSDWHLVPSSRPVIAMPNVKTTVVEVPGASGAVDLSELLTGYPLYQNRTGELDFHVLNDYTDDYDSWSDLYEEMANYLHGKNMKVVLEDDPDYYYEGRIALAQWISNNDGTWSDVKFQYDFDPYKYYKNDKVYTRSMSSTPVYLDFQDDSIGRMPVVPTFTVSGIGTGQVNLEYTNVELGVSALTKTITANGTRTFYDIILSRLNPSNVCTLKLSGSGTVKVQFRKGDL